MADQIAMQRLGCLCAAIARQQGIVLRDRGSLSPLHIEAVAKNDPFARGVLACLAQFVLLLDQSLDVGQSLPDLFLEPVRKDVEGPGGCGGLIAGGALTC